MRGWVRRHPFLSILFVVYAALLTVVAFADGDTELPIRLAGLAILLVPAAFGLWIIGGVIDLLKRALARPAEAAVPAAVPAARPLDPSEPLDRRALHRLDLTTWEALCLQGLRDLGFHGLQRTADRATIGHTWLAIAPNGRQAYIFPRRFRLDEPMGPPAIEGIARRRGDHPSAGSAIAMTTGLLTPPARSRAAACGLAVFDGDDMVEMAKLVLPALPEVGHGEPLGFCGTCGAERLSDADTRCSVCGGPV